MLGRDLIGVQNLIKKHQASMAEINNHEPRIDVVSRSAQVTPGRSSFVDAAGEIFFFDWGKIFQYFLFPNLYGHIFDSLTGGSN